MSYMFDDFKNIRTFPAETRVFRDGRFVPELSTDNGVADLPLHIIHIGKISGEHDWSVVLNKPQNVFLTARIEVESDARIKLNIDADIEKISFIGKIIVKNSGKLWLDIVGSNNKSESRIKCETKLFAAAAGENRLSGLANISPNVSGAETDISFAALCAPNVGLLEMSPAQRISSAPFAARHAAAIRRHDKAQIEYLEAAGLSDSAAAELLDRAFMEEV